jgi:hypothetical protein
MLSITLFIFGVLLAYIYIINEKQCSCNLEDNTNNVINNNNNNKNDDENKNDNKDSIQEQIENNKPSIIFKDMFKEASPWIA